VVELQIMPNLLPRADEQKASTICPVHKVEDRCTLVFEKTEITTADFSVLGPPSPKTEHQHLKDAVVEASKRRAATSCTNFEEFQTVDTAFDMAVEALIAFEAEHGIK